ncbi:MAG: flagellar basal-body rod protein FlgF [Patescibacteria group bacterium]|nr:flagellar basal-body rod protein FlgF [Patescibacteria group bacterium]
MPYGLYISAEGAHAQSKRLEVIANNLANVDTVGFKRDLAIFQARYAEAVQEGSVPPNEGDLENVGGGVQFLETSTDFAPGPLKHTQQKTDVAIEGDGFFVVEKDGEEFLTRAGNFTLTANGELRTQQGYAVLSDSGIPIVVNAADDTWQITQSGSLRQLGTIQNLAVVQPNSLNDLMKMGENLFRPLAPPETIPLEQRRIVAGYLEGSGVKATSEMTAMIEASRVLEANLNMMKSQNEMLGGLVNRVLKV